MRCLDAAWQRHFIIGSVFHRLLFSCSLLLARDGFDGLNIAIAKRDNELRIVFAEKSLNTLDGITLIIKQVANAFEQFNIKRTIIATTTASLHRFYLGKACFPKTQHMLRKIEIFCYFAYSPECIRAFVHLLALSSGLASPCSESCQPR